MRRANDRCIFNPFSPTACGRSEVGWVERIEPHQMDVSRPGGARCARPTLRLHAPYVLLLLLTPLTASGQTPPPKPEDQVPTTKLVVRPAAEPRAPLHDALLPSSLDRRPGNAATAYGRVIALLSQTHSDKTAEKVPGWLELPLEKFPREEVRKALTSHWQSVLKELDSAARRERCDWELPLGQSNVFTMVLPELSTMRELGRLVALQAKLQIADGRTEEAIHTLQTGYALGRHMGQGQTLIHGLVGVAICQTMSARVEELLQQPGTRNLYWTLTVLPQPLIDMRPGLDIEMHSVYFGFPWLRDVDRSRNDLPYWQNLIDKTERELGDVMFSGPAKPKAGYRPAVVAMALIGYPLAKRVLIERGFSAAEAGAMPVPKVIFLATMQNYEEARDQMFKWFALPYWEARPGLERFDRNMLTEVRHREIVPLASLLLPAVSAVKFAIARNDRSIALLRTVEALRIYGAAHEGRLPEKLADVTEVPLPIDPITGQAFSYRKAGDMAVIEAPAPAGRPQSQGRRLEIQFAK